MIRSPEYSELFTDLLEILLRIAEGVEAIAGARCETKSESWRDDPASEKQNTFMSVHQIPFNRSTPKGQASDLIDGYRANQKKGG